MSDQPLSDSTEPVPPSPPPVPGHADQPATFGQPTPADPTLPGRPADPAGYPEPGQPSVSAGQPWGTYPTDQGAQPYGWAWPMPAGAYPGQPPLPTLPYGWHPAAGSDDPLVTPPLAGVGGWFARCSGTLRRSWRSLLPIMLLTQGLPAAVTGFLAVGAAPGGEVATRADGTPVLPDGYFGDLFTFYGLVLLAVLLSGPLQAAGWAAGTWLVTRQAAGESAGVGAALRYGWRRALGLWGWTVVATLLITVGACLCVLPGICAAFAVALFGPIYLFERQEPIGRSVKLFHQRFGMVLGRVALVLVVLVVAAVVNGVLETISQLAFGVDPMAAPGTTAGAVLLAVAGAVLVTPAYLAQLVGLVVTYAEQRAHEGPVNAARLAAELG